MKPSVTPSASLALTPAAQNRRARRALVAAGSVLAVVGLAACTSVPSNERVARDIIETQGSLPDDVRQCMLDLLDAGNYDFDKIGEDNKNFDTPEELAASGSPEYQQLVADLTSCRTDAATGSTDVTGSSEPSESTDASSPTGTEPVTSESSPATPSGSTAG